MLQSTKQQNFLSLCDKIAFVLLCVITLDTCIFGAGDLISFGPVGFRQALLILLGLVSIPVMISRWKELIRNKYVWFVVAFLVWAFISIFFGPTDVEAINIIMPSFNSFIYFIILPIALVLITTRKRMHILMKTVIWGSLILSIITIAHLVLYLYAPSHIMEYVAYHGLHLNFFRIAYISNTIPRLVFLSSLYMIGACVFSFYFSITEQDDKKKWLYWITIGLSLFSLLISYTRAIYLGIIVSAIGVGIIVFSSKDKAQIKKFLFSAIASFAIFAIVLSGFSLLAKTDYLSYAFSRSAVTLQSPDQSSDQSSDSPDGDSDESVTEQFNELTQQSDQGRLQVVTRLFNNIKRSPIIGNGFGFDESTEYFFLDIWGKSGIIGLLLFLLPFFEIIRQIFFVKKKSIGNRTEQTLWLSFLLGIMTYSLLNPYISSYLGIFIYICTMVVTEKTSSTKQ